MAKWTFEPGHTAAEFRARHMMVTYVRGHFKNVHGTLEFDPETPRNSSVAVQIDTRGIWTGVKERDDHLRSADFLDATNHPQIKFVSTKIAKVDDKNLTITGDLTLRGITKSLNVPVKVVFLREGDGRFKGDFQINRKDFGMKYNSMMNPVEDMVSIQFDFHIQDQERQKQRPQQAPPKPPAP